MGPPSQYHCRAPLKESLLTRGADLYSPQAQERIQAKPEGVLSVLQNMHGLCRHARFAVCLGGEPELEGGRCEAVLRQEIGKSTQRSRQ